MSHISGLVGKVRHCRTLSSLYNFCFLGRTWTEKIASSNCSLAVSDKRPRDSFHLLANVQVTCLRLNGLVYTTAALSFSAALYHCDSVRVLTHCCERDGSHTLHATVISKPQ
ncbi:hypothetical protein GOODEAATRI_025465 [Goodea atripinnis]|uniref:Uncharacterized protein n=1 Tax=Goodea atripinnis TaxID=208336 RepID=A0ABV0NXL3_9TELE